MRYDKPPLSFEAQADLLLKRGLVADQAVLIDRLKNVNYYRLSGYLYPYRQADDNFKPNTTFEQVWRHYTFDRRLRLIVMDAIERVEVSVRTQLIYAFAHTTGAFGYTRASSLSGLSAVDYSRWIEAVKKELDHSRETFVTHFKKKYGDNHDFLPLWMAGEIISFGCTLTMYRGASAEIKKRLSQFYGIPDVVLTSWLQTINVIRNICAHHSRLWNREFGVKPLLPNRHKYPQWYAPVAIPQNRIFGILTILRHFLSVIAPQSKWERRLLDLLTEYPEISRWSMGFPDNWKDCPIWQ